MSIFFQRTATIETTFTVKDHPEPGGLETVLVNTDIWTKLFSSDIEHAALTVKSAATCFSTSSALQEIVCWATPDRQTSSISVPLELPALYPTIFFSQALQLTEAQPVVVDEVILTALSREAYDFVRSHNEAFEDWICHSSRILRQGVVLAVSPRTFLMNGYAESDFDSRMCRLYVDMIEPVQQGYAVKGQTRFLVMVVPSPHTEAPTDAVVESFENENELFEINEVFFANSVLVPTSQRFVDATSAGIPNVVFRIDPLAKPVSPHQDDHTLYVHTADLGCIGILSGDWAAVCAHGTTHHRLVRIVAIDSLIPSRGVAVCSPLLMTNICSISGKLYVDIFALGQEPAPPIAKSITLARIPSQLSTDRVYQPLVVKSLQRHFGVISRFVQEGDIIAVGIDTDDILRLTPSDSDSDHAPKVDHVANSVMDVCLQRRPHNGVVFFQITQIIRNDPRQSDVKSSDDVLNESCTGNLGCWVNSNVTRILQVGVKQCRVPQIAEYLQLSCDWLLTGPTVSMVSPVRKMLSLTNTISIEGAHTYALGLSILLQGARGIGKFSIAAYIAQSLNFSLFEINCFDIIGENDTVTEATLRARCETAGSCAPCVLVLRHIDALIQSTQILEPGKDVKFENALRECLDVLQNSWQCSGHPVVVIATCSASDRIPASMLSFFKHHIAIEAPDEYVRYKIIDFLLQNVAVAADVSISTLAVQTAALVAADLCDLLARVQIISSGYDGYIRKLGYAPPRLLLTASDFEASIAKSRASYSRSIGAPSIPNVSWDDVGGLRSVKSEILETVQLPLDHPELFADGFKKRSGILLYGPPGTGKTMLAKAVATSCALNFFSVKGPELLNMYIGESEANVRAVFQKARDAAPCVVFFDELDSVAPKRGNHGDSGGVMDRIVSQLLAELDGLSTGPSGAQVFVIGATNRPDLLDPALLRPGRFDRMLYLGVSETHEAQFDILQALTRKFRLAPCVDLHKIAVQCPLNYTGADFYALCSDAMLNAMSQKVEELDAMIASLNGMPGPHDFPHPLTPQYFLSEMASSQDVKVSVAQSDFERALSELVPSVSQDEMNHYRIVQQRFSNSAVSSG